MQQFLNQITQQLGVSDSTARSATGGMLKILQQNADSTDFNALLGKLPGAEQLLGAAPAATEEASQGGGGMLGGLMKSASSLTGGKIGGGLGALSSLTAAGLDLNDIPAFASQFLGFVKGEAGSDLLGRVLQNLPELKKLL